MLLIAFPVAQWLARRRLAKLMITAFDLQLRVQPRIYTGFPLSPALVAGHHLAGITPKRTPYVN